MGLVVSESIYHETETQISTQFKASLHHCTSLVLRSSARFVHVVDCRIRLEILPTGIGQGTSFQYAKHSRPPIAEHRVQLQLVLYL